MLKARLALPAVTLPDRYGHSGAHKASDDPEVKLQALNNWGLVLQELAAMRPPAERSALVALSAEKFRRAMALRPDFDRACYNLGTVVYAHACQMQSSMQQHLSSALTQVGDLGPACRADSSTLCVFA